MGVRGFDELVAMLPPSAAEPARALADALADLTSLRHNALAAEHVRALGELWERLAGQVASGRLGVLAAMDARDDVIPKAKAGDAGAVFATHVLGQRSWMARRDGHWAGLLRPEIGDLTAVGAAYAAGDIGTAHVEVAARAHKDLGPKVREALVEVEIPECDGELRDALAALSEGFTAAVRQVRVVDVLLAHYARGHTVTEFEAIARRIVTTLNRPDPKGGHDRRYLHMSQLPDGSWRGRFECGAEQGLIIKRALAAYSEPRPGKAIDPDGVERQIPDDRDLGVRQVDALTDIAAIVLTKNHIPLPTPTPRDETADEEPTNESSVRHPTADAGDIAGESVPDQTPDEALDEALEEPPPGEGEMVILREPGVLVGPYPSVEMVLVAGIEHVAAAFAHRPGQLPINGENEFLGWVRDRDWARLPPRRESGKALQESDAHGDPSKESPPEEPRPEEAAARSRSAGVEVDGDTHQNSARACTCRSGGADLAWLGRALSPYGAPARIEQAGLVDPDTLGLLACSSTVRAALLAPGGALLDLGRSQRLATPAQKTALLARDGGCVIPGCIVPGDACDAHHVIWWENLGPTDLDNMALVCGRHHTEVHQGTWELQMLDSVPWVRLPSWTNRERPLLRNAAHHPHRNRRENP